MAKMDMYQCGQWFKILALLIALVWLFAELGYISLGNIPWLPLVIVVYIFGKVIKNWKK